MSIINTIKHLVNHPLNTNDKFKALKIFLKWQLGTKIQNFTYLIPYINDTKIIMRKGMYGATGNLYCGLHEVSEMGFLLHYLREDDVFCDVGANVGTYTVLGAGVVGCKTYSIEPGDQAFATLSQNVALNCSEKVTLIKKGVGDKKTELFFTTDEDTTNHISVNVTGENVSKIEVDTLDSILDGVSPKAIKIDVEGYEVLVLNGAKKVLSNEELNVVIMERRGHGEKYGLDDSDIDKIMFDAGFKIYTYDAVKREVISKNPEELRDAIYIRNLDDVLERISKASRFRLSFGREI